MFVSDGAEYRQRKLFYSNAEKVKCIKCIKLELYCLLVKNKTLNFVVFSCTYRERQRGVCLYRSELGTFHTFTENFISFSFLDLVELFG